MSHLPRHCRFLLVLSAGLALLTLSIVPAPAAEGSGGVARIGQPRPTQSEETARVNPVGAGTGGYFERSSSDIGGPVYEFKDIAGVGSPLVLADDGISGALPLGFSFRFFSESYSQLYVSANGFVTFLPPPHGSTFASQPLPDPVPPNGLIAGWWADLNPAAGGAIHTATVGSAPNRQFIVQYRNVPHLVGGQPVTMQIKLFEGLNTIEVHYQNAPSNGTQHTAGIENAAGTAGLVFTRAAGALATPLAVRYEKAGLSMTVLPAAQQVNVGESAIFQIQASNIGLIPLTNARVAAPQVPNCEVFIGNLAPGQEVNFPCLLPAVTTSFTNQVLLSAGATTGIDPIPDAVFANLGQSNQRCLTDLTGSLSCADVSPHAAASEDVALADVNRDLHLDALFANSETTNSQNRICLGDGQGGFNCTEVGPEENSSFGVDVGDLNRDGFLDAVFANFGQPDRLCLGDGQGAFSCANVSAAANVSTGVALGDMNGDSFLDAIFSVRAQPNQICFGNGAGAFTCGNVSPDTNRSSGVAVGDVNGDSFLDAIFSNDGTDGKNRICLGDGVGGFACSDVSADSFFTSSVALGDVDGDGALDALFGNVDQLNRVCLGNGAGAFTCSDVSADLRRTLDVAVGDLNGDRNLDALFANGLQGVGVPNQLCLGDGAGGFTCAPIAGVSRSSVGVALGDVGGTRRRSEGTVEAFREVQVEVIACPPDDPREPNDSVAQATPLTPGLTAGLQICSDNADYFTIALGPQETLTVDVLFSHAAGDLDVVLLDSAEAVVATSQSTNDNENIEYRSEDGGTFTLQVYGFNNAENGYQLQVTVTPDLLKSWLPLLRRMPAP